MAYQHITTLSSKNLRSTEVSDKLTSIESIMATTWLTSENVIAILATKNWESLLKASQNETCKDNRKLIQYFDTYGFISNKSLLSHAKKWDVIDGNVIMNLLEKFVSWEIGVNNFINQEPKEIKEEYPSLSISKIRLLQIFLERELSFNNIDLNNLIAQFPFPITKLNFFGRFIWWVAESPQTGVRHLKSATPFLIQVKALIEALQNEKRSFLMISSLSLEIQGYSEKKKEWTEDLVTVEEKRKVEREIKGEFLNILTQCIDSSDDLMASSGTKKMKCISLPKLPKLSASDYFHIEKKEERKLSLEIMNWIFFGDVTGELISRQAIRISDKKKLANIERNIPIRKKRLRKKKQELKDAYKKHQEAATLKNKNLCLKLESDVDYIGMTQKSEIKIRRGIKNRKSQIKPILKKLEEQTIHIKKDINEFRKTIKNAHKRWYKIIFTGFKNDITSSIFTEHLDNAFVQKTNKNYRCSQVLKNCAFMMSNNLATHISDASTNGPSLTKSHLCNFSFDGTTLTESARFVIEGIPRKKNEKTIRQLLDFLIKNIPVNSIHTKAQLKYLVCESLWKRNPTINDYLEYIFEHLLHIEKDTLIQLLNHLRDLWHSEIPERCRQIIKERFHISTHVLDQFSIYSEKYKPKKIWDIPMLFEDKATLIDYLSLNLDGFWMFSELEELERCLTTWKWIVGVIDSTEYHPEFISEIYWEKEKDAVESSSEIWWDYVRPSERLIRSFGARVMEGRTTKDLKDYSLISVKNPSKENRVLEKLYKLILGIDLNLTPDLSRMSKLLSDLHNYDEKTILIINAENVKNLEQYKEFIKLLENFRFKVILQLREWLPGLPQVMLKPFLDTQITERLLSEEPYIRSKLGLQEPISRGVIDFAVNQVKKMREPSDDPLNLVLQILNGSAQNARMGWYSDIQEQDVTFSMSSIFHLPDADQMRARMEAIDNFIKIVPWEVLGQETAIKAIWKKMKSHILWLRDPSRPLTLILPGPTWVGKTELMVKLAQSINMPFFHIEWAEFSEPHTIARLIWSPSWYVWPDEGILYKFAQENTVAIVFIDEIEKMHPDVYTALMNFFDKAILTAGDGQTVRRPGFVIVGASNAGADFLKQWMSERETKEVLSDAFVDRNGKRRPELVRRFDPIMMLPIQKDAFKEVIKLNLNTIWERFGLINSNLRLHGIDQSAIDILYEESLEVCQYANENTYGFSTGEVNTWGEVFFDMRHIGRALDTLLWDSMTGLVEKQIRSWQGSKRGAVKKVELVGNKKERNIIMREC